MQGNDPAANQLTVYLMVGIPGAGKSTWVRKNSERNCIGIALDEIRRKLYGYSPTSKLYKRLEVKTWKNAIREASHALNGGRNVILDSIALTKVFRGNIIKQLKNAIHNSFDVVAVFVDTPLDVALDRNRKRDKFVEESVIRELANVLEPPELAEGFKEIMRL